MTPKPTDRLLLSATASNLIRIVIASYFLALSVGIIPGTDLSALFSSILPDPWAGWLGSAIVFSLAYFVLVGAWLRGAALLLAIVLFWSSYISMAQLGLEDRIGSFWRDLALIAALIMTYAEPDPRNRTRRGMFRVLHPVRRVTPREMVTPRRIHSSKAPMAPVIPFRAAAPAAGHDTTEANIFRDDFEVARVS